MTPVYVCECGHEKAEHQGGAYWCRVEKCGGCKKYTPDFNRRVPVPVMPGGESTSALLRQTQTALAASQADLTRVEQERDEARAALSNALQCFDDLQTVAGRKYLQLGAERDVVQVRLDLARAELASARIELAQLRAATTTHHTEGEPT